ncbi:hypothetical protein BJ912DRAFT_906054 [Pholiota molesta]|nr:hypothetical protein BJ912DRAFT_906054 [Pholiota molesta]
MCAGGGLTAEHPKGVTASPIVPPDWRRRSADVGGLHLATTNEGQGQGWMGGDSVTVETHFAELLGDMYTQSNSSVNDNSPNAPPTELPSSVRSRLIHSLDRWHFEPHKLPDEELIECTLILFEVLFRVEGMKEAIPVSMKQISSFIHHLRGIYRYENSYHNFEHALDVLQATQSYLKSAGMVPSPMILFEPNRTWKPTKSFDGQLIACLGLRELFILYVAAIGHDVGHPGFSNVFMKNAKTPLSLVFNDTSALENLHCLLLLQVMKQNGLGALLDDPTHGHHLRKILQQTVLATDMGVHKEFMERMQRMLDGERTSICYRQIIICQAILKNADISNPTRPFLVSKHWANALMQEWTAQAQFEEELQLAPTVMSSDDPIKEAGGQIFFITNFAKPLLELTEKAVPEMCMYTTHCKLNLKTWKKRQADLTMQRQREAASASSKRRPLPPPPPHPPDSRRHLLRPPYAYMTAFPLSLPTVKIGTESAYAPSSSGRSENESSAPESPTESESVSSTMFSPASSSSSSSNKCLSTISGSVAGSSAAPPPHAAIRAASRMGSMRQLKDARAKRGARNSWCAATTATMAALFHSTPTSSSSSSASPTASPLPPPRALADPANVATPKKLMTAQQAPPPGAPPPLQPPGGTFMIPRPFNLSVVLP